MPHEESQPSTKTRRAEIKRETSLQPVDLPEKADAVELKTIEIRLKGVKESAQRSRFVFLVMTIAASAILITLWNSYLSWYKDIALEQRQVWKGADDSSRVLRNQDELLAEWIKNRTVSVGLLGIRVAVSDFAVLGSATLVVVMIWYFFSQRRENRAIVSLLRDCVSGLKESRLNEDDCRMVYQGIVHSLVFIDVEKGDKPWSGLRNQKNNAKPSLIKKLLSVLTKKLLLGLAFLPPITIFVIFFFDCLTLFFMQSAFRTSPEPLWKIVFYEGTWVEEAKVVGFELFALSSSIYTGYLCTLSRGFSRATSRTLRHFEVVLRHIKSFHKNPDRLLKRLEKSS